jgi:hypothetical protein
VGSVWYGMRFEKRRIGTKSYQEQSQEAQDYTHLCKMHIILSLMVKVRQLTSFCVPNWNVGIVFGPPIKVSKNLFAFCILQNAYNP